MSYSMTNRWLVVVGAVLIQLALRAIYAWSVFTPPLKTAGWTATETQAVFPRAFTICVIAVLLAALVTAFVKSPERNKR